MNHAAPGPGFAVVLQTHAGRDPRHVRSDRERAADDLRQMERLLRYLWGERSLPMITDRGSEGVEARWHMSTGHRIHLNWADQDGPLSVAFVHMPKPVLDTFSEGTALDHDRPWITAGIVSERCAAAADALLCDDGSTALSDGCRLQSALAGWIVLLEEASGRTGLHAAAASPWNRALVWEGDHSFVVLDHEALGIAPPGGVGVAVHDSDGPVGMGSIVVHGTTMDTLGRLRAIADYRESLA